MVKKKTSFLRRLGELISQNKLLVQENEFLLTQVEELTSELDKYKQVLEETDDPDIIHRSFKSKDKTQQIRVKNATVLYADALGFNEYLRDIDSKILVDSLEEVFFQLESIIDKYDISRLKTLGDTIMCAGGILQKNITNPIEVVLAAVEMRYYINELQKNFDNEKVWKLRIGIHTGPANAIITGRKKKNIELKGDTVNLATRIRSFCKEGEILITAHTYEIIKDLFDCEYFSKMPVKYKGDLQLYKVRGIRKEYSLRGKGIIPNKAFIIEYGLAKFTDLQELVLDRLEKELPNGLYYHNVKHTVDVVTQAELIGLGEGVSDEELLLLKTAALFHDTGHIIGYDQHEFNSTIIARDMLPEFYYSQKQIDQICDLIMATKMPPNPQNKLEAIMCDADLDYLGRSDMIPVSNALFRELKEHNRIDTLDEWNRMQVKFISGHQYFTNTARSLREVKKQQQIERIKSLVNV